MNSLTRKDFQESGFIGRIPCSFSLVLIFTFLGRELDTHSCIIQAHHFWHKSSQYKSCNIYHSLNIFIIIAIFTMMWYLLYTLMALFDRQILIDTIIHQYLYFAKFPNIFKNDHAGIDIFQIVLIDIDTDINIFKISLSVFLSISIFSINSKFLQ